MNQCSQSSQDHSTNLLNHDFQDLQYFQKKQLHDEGFVQKLSDDDQSQIKKTYFQQLYFEGEKNSDDLLCWELLSNSISQHYFLMQKSQNQMGTRQEQKGRETKECMKGRRRKKTKKTPSQKIEDTKNFLKNFKKIFLDFILQNDPSAKHQELWIYLNSKNSINLQDYENLFKKERYQQILQKMFISRHLQRQMQLSRASKQVRLVNLTKIRIFYLAFKLKWFPRIR